MKQYRHYPCPPDYPFGLRRVHLEPLSTGDDTCGQAGYLSGKKRGCWDPVASVTQAQVLGVEGLWVGGISMVPPTWAGRPHFCGCWCCPCVPKHPKIAAPEGRVWVLPAIWELCLWFASLGRRWWLCSLPFPESSRASCYHPEPSCAGAMQEEERKLDHRAHALKVSGDGGQCCGPWERAA